MDTYDAVGFIVGFPGTGVGISEIKWCGLIISDGGSKVGETLNGNEGCEVESREGGKLRIEGEVEELVADEGERLVSNVVSNVS